MSHLSTWSAGALALACAAFTPQLAACGLLEKMPDRDDWAEYPLRWVDDGTLLVGHGHRISLRKTGGESPDEHVLVLDAEDRLPDHASGCFSGRRMVFTEYQRRPGTEGSGDDLAVVAYRQVSFENDYEGPSISDGHVPDLLDPRDCSPLPASALVVSADGFRSRLDTALDSSSNRVLLIDNPGRFERGDDGWPTSAVWIDADGTAGEIFEVPPGPWVRDEVRSDLSCFSCGCDCYRFMDIAVAQKNLFAVVYGRGHYREDLGVYRLDLEDVRAGWDKIVDEPVFPPIAVSPDGCRLAVGGGTVQIEELCGAGR